MTVKFRFLTEQVQILLNSLLTLIKVSFHNYNLM